MKAINNFICAAVGFVLGGACVYAALNEKFESKYKEESQRLRDLYFGQKQEQDSSEPNDDSETEKEPVTDQTSGIMEYAKILSQTGYRTSYNDVAPTPEKDDDISVVEPVLFGLEDDYETLSLTVLSDDIVLDSDGRKMSEDDILQTIGSEWRKEFGKYEDDAVYIKNDNIRTYFEVLKDERDWDEYVKEHPEYA